MRYLSIIFLFILISTVVAAQTNYCGMPQNALNELREQVVQAQQHPHQYKQSPQDTTYYIPLKAHIVGTDAGTGYYNITSLFDAMCNLNQQMAQANMYFYLKGSVNYIDNSDYYSHDYQDGGMMMAQYNVSNAVNVYFVNNPNDAGGYYSPQLDAIAIRNASAGPNNTTVAHEIGHFFGLPHTFHGWEGTDIRNNESIPTYRQELVNGSNCSQSNVGDGFCDTPPDYFSFRWNCPASYHPTDPNGDTINPDETLYMSYASDHCSNRFSQSQKEYMVQHNLLNNRSNLLNGPVPNTDTLGTVELLSPPQNQNGLSPGQTKLHWAAAKNATHYYLQVFGSGGNFEVITTDTVYEANLNPNKTYYWKITPFSRGNTCTEASSVKSFQTGDAWVIKPSANVSGPSCHNASDGTITIDINHGGTPPYDFSWDNGATGSAVNGVQAGVYTVTVTDDANNQSVLPVVVNNPAPVSATIDSNNNGISIDASGGTPPHSFEWSNGATGSTFTPSEAGTYTVTVSDAKNCQTIEQVTLDKNDVNVSAQSRAKVEKNAVQLYPNPLTTGQMLNIDLPEQIEGQGTIGLYSVEGKLIRQLDHDFGSGGSLSIGTDGLSEGLYLLRIQSHEQSITKKVLLF